MSNPTFNCGTCGAPVAREPTDCPKCGDLGRVIHIGIQQELNMRDSLEIQLTDTDGELKVHELGTSDGRKEGALRITRSEGGDEITTTGHALRRPSRADDNRDENEFSLALMHALNRRDGRCYALEEEKEKDDYDFPDRWIVDEGLEKNHRDRRLGVEVTMLDREARAGLGMAQRFSGTITPEEVVQQVQAALALKRDRSREICDKTYLLLTSMYPLSLVREQVQAAVRAAALASPYRGVWLGGLDQPPFPVHVSKSE